MAVDPDDVRRVVATGLPERVRWRLQGVAFDLDFSLAREPLQPLSPEEYHDCTEADLEDAEPELATAVRFGTQHLDGGASAYLCVDLVTGRILGLDLEREQPLFLLNSDIHAFVRTLVAIGEGLRLGARPTSLPDINPSVFEASEWRMLAEALGWL